MKVREGEKNIQGHPRSFPPWPQNISVYSASAHSWLKPILPEESIWLKYWAFMSCYIQLGAV